MSERALLNPEQVSAIIKIEPLMEGSYFPVALNAGAGGIHLDYCFPDSRVPVRITLNEGGKIISVSDWLDETKPYSIDGFPGDWAVRESSLLKKSEGLC